MHAPRICEFVFVKILDEINARSKSGSFYDALRVSGLLRQLLCEKDAGSPSLIDQVDPNIREQKIFEVVIKRDTCETLPKPTISIQGALHPAGASLLETEYLDATNLLAREIFSIDSFSFSFKDMIVMAANWLGGIHLGKPPKKNKKRLEYLNVMNTVRHGNLHLGFKNMLDLAYVVTLGLSKESQKIEAKFKPFF